MYDPTDHYDAAALAALPALDASITIPLATVLSAIQQAQSFIERYERDFDADARRQPLENPQQPFSAGSVNGLRLAMAVLADLENVIRAVAKGAR